jgi:endonuclease YncB( thermonuclease family)
MTVWLALALAPLLAQANAATVLSVGDGDSLRLRRGDTQLKVRLACIDAPELRQRPEGEWARQALQALLPVGSGVAVRRLATDRYGREVVELSHRGRNVNQALVARGAAFVYWAYIRGCDRQTYGRLETQARLQRLGVWASPGGLLRPWELRARSRR